MNIRYPIYEGVYRILTNVYPFQLQRMARIQFIQAKGGFLFPRKGSRLPAKEQKKTETGGR